MINELIRRYWPAYSGRLEKRPGGWNNTTFFVEGNRYKGIFRIYETHKDHEKIRFEHAVLEALQHQPLSFKVPAPVRTADGDTLVQLGADEGKYPCSKDEKVMNRASLTMYISFLTKSDLRGGV
ncbi:phosphotransferase [Paenibacillus terreus]|uniref:Phosphotransferase n=1 Tax=Paenibacillus terreus TaxID=1387834 RepID=A0ABV5BFF1_9BACL